MQKSRKWLFQVVTCVLAIGAGLLLFFNQRELIRLKKENRQLLIDQQEDTKETIRQGGLVQLMSHVLEKAEDELKVNGKRTLSDETIAQIAALSYSFTSHKFTTRDSTTQFPLSPGRGQLLLMLLRMEMDSMTIQKIKTQTSFAGAVLREADLKGADLSGYDLRGTDFQDADLAGANLSKANLMYAKLWGANLNKANLSDAFVKRADMRWAEMNDANLYKTDLHEADLTSAKLRHSDLRGTILQWADFTSAILDDAVLDSADMFRTVLTKTQLNNTSIQNANLTLANVCEANLTNTNLTGANLHDVVIKEKDWLARLPSWPVIGAQEIQQAYQTIDETSTGVHLYQLKKK